MIAQSVKAVKDSGLKYQVGSMGTLIEGESEQVFEVLKQMHMKMRQQSKRVSTLIKIDDQVDRPLDRLETRCLADDVSDHVSALIALLCD